ncbi:MAG: STAS domain-containing protein [Bacteroidota bacterium]
MASFSVSFSSIDAPSGSVHVLGLSGELDAHTAPEFEHALQDCLRSERTRLVVSGDDLRYVSSAGLGVFMAYLEPVRSAGGDLKIAALSEEVFEVFDLLGFPLLFDIADTAEAAAARFDAAPEASGNA